MQLRVVFAAGVMLLGAARVEAAPPQVVVVEPENGASIAFPRTPYDQNSPPQRIRLRNDGGPIGFEDFQIFPTPFALVATGGDLEPGHEKFYDVVCRPRFPGRLASETVVITLCNGGVEQLCENDDITFIEIALSCPTGLVETPRSEVTLPSAYGYEPSELLVSFSNPGSAPVTITALRPGSAVFSAQPQTGVLPRTLAPGATLDLVVRFKTDGLSAIGTPLTDTIDVLADAIIAGRVRVRGTVLSAVAPLQFDRGVVPEGAVYTIPFAVRNSYPSTRTITATTSTGDDYRVLGLVGVTLAPGEIAHGLVSVTGTRPTFRVVDIAVAFNVGQQETATFSHENSSGLSIVVSDDTPDDGRLDFGAHRTGTATIERTITITNPRPRPLNVAGCLVVVPPFELVSSCPTVIPAGGSADFTVRFTPGAAGDLVAKVGLQLGSSQLFAMLSARVLVSQLAFSDDAVAFTGVPRATGAERRVSITNLADDAITVPVAVTGDAFTVDIRQVALPGRGTVEVTVAFHPPAAGAFSGSLELGTADAPVHAVIPLSGSGVSPLVSVAETLDLGTVAVGGVGEAMLEIRNRDLAHSFVIEQLTIDGAVFTAALPADPMLAPGAAIQVPVRFAPTAAGPSTGSLAIVLAGDTAPHAIVALSGTGASPNDLPSPLPDSSGCSAGAPGWLGFAILGALTAIRRRVRWPH